MNARGKFEEVITAFCESTKLEREQLMFTETLMGLELQPSTILGLSYACVLLLW